MYEFANVASGFKTTYTADMRPRPFMAACAILGALLAFVILWKGGKSLEATWLLVGCVFLVVLAALFVDPKQRMKGTSLFLPITLLLFLGWSLASFLQSQTANYGLDELLRDGACAALFLSLLPLLRVKKHREDMMRWLLSVLSLSTIAAGAIGIFVYALQPVNRFVGTFFDFRFDTDFWPNAWAQFLLLSWPLLILWLQPWRKKIWWLRILLLAFVFATLFLSYSRGAVLALGGQIILLLILLLWQHRSSLKARAGGNIVMIGIATAALAWGIFSSINLLRSQFHDVQSVSEKVTFTAAEGTSSIDERSQFWRQAVTITKERPWFGYGPYSFRFVQPRLQEGILATSDHPHNVFLKLSAERGIPSALFFLLFLCGVFFPALSAIARGRSTDEAPFMLVAVAGVLAHNLIDYNLQFVGIALPLWVLFALLATESLREHKRLRTNVVNFLAFTLVSVCFFVAVREIRPLIASSRGRHAEVAGQLEGALSHYQNASDQWYPRDLELSKTGVLIALHQLAEARTQLASYRTKNPVDARAFTVAGFLDLSFQKPDEAFGQFSRAYSLGGLNDASILRGLLLSLRDLRRPAQNKEWEDRIMQRLEEYVVAVKGNTHFIALSKNVEETKQAIDLAKTIYPWRAPELTALAVTLEKEATEERARLQGRAQGLLW